MGQEGRQRRRQTERRQEAEQRILMAAAELIGEIGPARTTLSDIGERAGYSRSLTTHHFGTKRVLLSRIIETVTVKYYEDLARHRPASAIDGVCAVVNTYFDELDDLDPLIRARIALWAHAAVSGSPEDRQEATAADAQFRNEIMHRLQGGIDSGEIEPSVDAAGLATALLGLLRGTALQLFLDPKFDLDASRQEALAMIAHRLTPAD